MIRDLERRVKRLERENQELRDRNAELGQPASERLQHQLEELESLGELNAMPASFWGLLKKAADSLEMPEHSNYYAAKI